MVKMAPATSASPPDAAVRAIFCFGTPPPPITRKTATAMTAAGMVAAIVWPAFIHR